MYLDSVHDMHAGTIGVSTRIEHKFLLPTSQILGARKIEVCKTAFCRAYGISHWTLNQMAVRLKKNEDSHGLEFNDRSGSISSLREAESIGQRHNLVPALTVEVGSFSHCSGDEFDTFILFQQQQCTVLKNTHQSGHCYLWMKVYFDQFGDHIPNSKDQIHLDPIDKFTIYEEYMQEIQISNIGITPLCYSKFLIMWTTLFSHGSIREFKAVTGQKLANQY